MDFLGTVWLCVFWALLCFVTSFITNNYSQVDKLWSITPWIYIWVWYFQDAENEKLLLVAVLTTLWGIRLTYNFNRRGGYQWPPWTGEEDYRWDHVRSNMKADENPIKWQLFNLCFVCLYQHFLLLLIASPAYFLGNSEDKRINTYDIGVSFMFLATLLFETVADNQQFAFQEEKHRKYKLIKKGQMKQSELSPMESDGFLSSGFWSLCRHPNYAAEQFIWILVYAFSMQVSALNWTLVGPFLLLTLFQPSADLSEGITAKKYPNYKKFIAAKFKFLPIGGQYSPGSSN